MALFKWLADKLVAGKSEEEKILIALKKTYNILMAKPFVNQFNLIFAESIEQLREVQLNSLLLLKKLKKEAYNYRESKNLLLFNYLPDLNLEVKNDIGTLQVLLKAFDQKIKSWEEFHGEGINYFNSEKLKLALSIKKLIAKLEAIRK